MVLKSIRWCILCILGLFFLQKSLAFDKVFIKISRKHHDFKFMAKQFLNGWSYKHQIGLKLKLIDNSSKKYKKGNFILLVHQWTDRPMDPQTNELTNQQTNGPTDQWTNQKTDKSSYRVACPWLKIKLSNLVALWRWFQILANGVHGHTLFCLTKQSTDKT